MLNNFQLPNLPRISSGVGGLRKYQYKKFRSFMQENINFVGIPWRPLALDDDIEQLP